MSSAQDEYAGVYRQSLEDPATFWAGAAAGVSWIRKPRQALDDSGAPVHRWYPGARLNVCYNALDRHVVAGRADQDALIHDSPVTGTRRRFSYAELLDLTARFAGGLQALGVNPGDTVLIGMPALPEAVIAMLACARIGAVHAMVPGGLDPADLAARIDEIRPRVVVSASCALEPTRVVEHGPLLEEALRLAGHQPGSTVILQRQQAPAQLGPKDVEWRTLMTPNAVPPAGCVAVAATDPLYLLSGAGGRPAALVRDSGGYVAALDWSMRTVHGVGPGEVMFTTADVDPGTWHSYVVYGPLVAGATTVLSESEPVGTLQAGAFWRVLEEHGVSVVLTTSATVQEVRRADPDPLVGRNVERLRALFLTGEGPDAATRTWSQDRLGAPVSGTWWRTDAGWPI